MNDCSKVWSVAEITDEASVMIVRFRGVEIPDVYIHRVRIVSEYQPTTPNLLPSNDDLRNLNELEASLNQNFEHVSQSLLTHVITGDGVRQWVFYAGGIDRFMHALNTAIPNLLALPISIDYEVDANHDEYIDVKAMLDNASAAG